MTAPATTSRLDTIDLLRGLVIALMVLDHARDYFHINGFTFSPTDLTKTTPALFMTRWVTHLCALTFVFLAGVSVHLQKARGKPNLSLFLLTRGVWLIVLEVTVVSFGFNFAEPFALVQVIWAIGASFVLMAGLVHLPRVAVGALAAVIVLGHDLATPIDATHLGAFKIVWNLTIAPGFVPPVIFGYPVIPWLGIMMLGYCFGPLFLQATSVRNKRLAALACGSLATFVVLRVLNRYGDPRPWGSDLHPVLSFINVSKQPPCLDYVLLFLGLMLFVFLLLDRFNKQAAPLLLPFGRTPLFTYVAHVYLVHASAMLVGVVLGFPAKGFLNVILDSDALVNAGWGFNLPVVYLATLLIFVALYPASRWFAAVKARRSHWWLSYL